MIGVSCHEIIVGNYIYITIIIVKILFCQWDCIEISIMNVSPILLLHAVVTVTMATQIKVDTSRVIHKTDEHYLSFNIDSTFFKHPDRWTRFNNTSTRLGVMLAVFSPCILRVGGSPADWTVFNANLNALRASNLSLPQPVTVMTKQDWYNFNWLVRDTGLRLLFDLNLQLRFGQNWDPTNTAELMDFSTEQQMGESVDFELGNEPNVYKDGFVMIDPDHIGHDFVSLRQLSNQYSWFRRSRIVGPDVVGTDPDRISGKIIQSVAEIAGKDIDAITFHHYYFRGDNATLNDYLNPAYFADLEQNIQNVQNIITNTSNPNLPYWIGETADAWHLDAAGLCDRYVSGFLWLDKLGLSAAMGVGVVMRQTFWGGNNGLVTQEYDPTPDYWLSLMYVRLVGHKVLSVSASSDKPNTTRVYAHCTNLRYRFPKPYPAGSVIVYGLNMAANLTETIKLTGELANQDVDVYLMTPGDNLGMLAKTVKVNGKVLEIQGDHGIPFVIDPVKSHTSKGLVLPPQTFGFFVLPNANIKVCN